MFPPREATCGCGATFTQRAPNQSRCPNCKRKARTRQVAESLARCIKRGTVGKTKSDQGKRFPYYWELECE